MITGLASWAKFPVIAVQNHFEGIAKNWGLNKANHPTSICFSPISNTEDNDSAAQMNKSETQHTTT